MISTIALLLGLVMAAQGGAPKQQPQPAQKAEIVSVTGCLKLEGTNNWTLINATDPVTSRANAPTADQMPKEPVAGKNQFKLIGVSEFPLQDKKDKTVVVKGLLVKATPVNRLNITSVTKAFDTCTMPRN